MTPAPRVIAPRSTSTTRSSITTQGLSDELLGEQIRRLRLCAGVAIGLWMFGLVMDAFVRPRTVGSELFVSTLVIEALAIVVSGVLFTYLRFTTHPPRIQAHAGLAFMVLNAMGVGLLNTWARPLTADALNELSWNTIVILCGSMLMPATPKQMLAAALLSATMDPLGIALAAMRGREVPTAVNTFVLFLPNYACALAAVVPVTILNRLARRLRHAKELGSYHLVRLLGRGGMGEVWLGRHQLLARSAAVKLVRPEVLGAGSEAAASVMLRRFEREAQATASLSSPHSIRLFDFGVTEDRTFYYVMELLAGRDLETLVREFGPLPADRVVWVLRQVCHSLAEAHARGLVHRDITPANIYLCRMGLDYDFVKVLDFGLVKFDAQRELEHTLMGGHHATAGTPAFMAPELIAEGEVDARADVYSLGCVAYYLLTGQLVFEADTAMKMFLQHLQGVPAPPSQRTELPIPPDVDALVMACLAKDPSRRPRNAEEVSFLLETSRGANRWSNESARGWWQLHLPELAGPLATGEPVEIAATTPALAGFHAG
ncbi:MAG TPA: serine/threonine-protein kinase [Vicinamibacterales bacterium]|jgi:serine/threonine-protein kinase|nr:serine/threonine-protein kinase [Vicinamibacterales bacterium]